MGRMAPFPKGDLHGPRHLDDLVLTFGEGVAPVPPAAKGHRDLGVRASVKKPHTMGRGGTFIESEDQAGLAPALAGAVVALQHVQLLKEIDRGLANPKKRPGHLGFLGGWPLNEFSIATYSM